jgi:NitT/TauT family transport system substrate-binding protein
MKKSVFAVAALMAASTSFASDSLTVGGGTFNQEAGNCVTIGFSHYVGWEPYSFLARSEILGKRAREHNVCITVEMIPDYITSLEQFSNGNVQGITVTNMDLLSFQSSTGSTEVIIAGDYSNGNDAILVRSDDVATVADLKGKEVGIVELSVNDYLLERCLTIAGMSRSDVKVVNFTSEADIATQFAAQGGTDFAATVWNPVLLNLKSEVDNATTVCDSSDIPGEIVDLLVVDQNLDSNVKQAMVDAWYDTMAVMSKRSKSGKAARTAMALNAENTLAEYDSQLRTTAMWYKPADAAAFLDGPELVKTTKSVYDFTRKAGIVTDPQSISINGTLVIDEAGPANISYTSSYTKSRAAE